MRLKTGSFRPTSCPGRNGGQSPRVAWWLLGLWLAWGSPVHVGSASEAGTTPGTRRMAAILERLAREADPAQVKFLNRERVALARRALLSATNAVDEFRLRMDLALEQLNAGEPEEALRTLGGALPLTRQNAGLNRFEYKVPLFLQMATAQFKLGELENCLARHTADSCLFPIRTGGVHVLPRGSVGALSILTNVLVRTPDHLDARWLANLAYSTLGRYPGDVPAEVLIPPAVFESEAPFPRLPNVAIEKGLDFRGLAGGVIADDFDNDGDFDLLLSQWGLRDPMRYIRNNGDGTFSEATAGAGLGGITGGLNMVQADYDNDGWVDVLVLRGAWMGAAGNFPCSLLRNRGGGRFEDVTEAAGMLRFRPTQTAAWLDFDGDGWLDVFIGNESTPGAENPSELFRNNGNGTFTEVARACGVDLRKYVKGVTAGDYDNDGRPDLYLSDRDGDNVLLHNDGPAGGAGAGWKGWRFADRARAAGVTGPHYSFPTAFFDYDNDGRLDLWVSGYFVRGPGDVCADYLGMPTEAERMRLYRNRGDGTFDDVTKAAGLFRVVHTMGCNLGDLDNDGWLDLYAGTGDPSISLMIPNRLFRNAGGQRFQDVTTAAGVGHLQKGHAVAFADFDRDGDQDIYESMGGAFSGDLANNVFFQNPGSPGHWFSVRLRGVRSNRSAIGSRIEVAIQDGKVPRRIYREVNSGASFGGNPLEQFFGIGAATEATVTLRWAGSGLQETRVLRAGAAYAIEEGHPGATVLAGQRGPDSR